MEDRRTLKVCLNPDGFVHEPCNEKLSQQIDVRHEKTDLKVFVVVIPKVGWARPGTPILLLGGHQLLENVIYEVKRLKY